MVVSVISSFKSQMGLYNLSMADCHDDRCWEEQNEGKVETDWIDQQLKFPILHALCIRNESLFLAQTNQEITGYDF